MKQVLRSGIVLTATAAMAALVSACADDESPFARENNVLYDKALLVPDHITPPIKVMAVEGAPEHWRLHERVAAALREREIPAGTEGQSGASYTLKGSFSVPEENDGRIKIAWQLHDNAGNAVGEVMQMTAITNAAWGTRETGELGMVSQAAAESLAPLVPSAALDDTQFAENTGEPSDDDPTKRFGPVTALARKANVNEGGLSDRFVGLANVDEVQPLPASAAALGIEPDDEAAEKAAQEAARKEALPPAQMPPLPEADRVPGPTYEIPNSTFGIEPAPGGADDGSAEAPSAVASADAAGPAPAGSDTGQASGSAAPSAVPASAEGGSAAGAAPYWVQLGAYRDRREGEAAWADLAAEHPKLLEGRPHAIHRADLESKGVFYRVKLGPFTGQDEALGAWTKLARAGVDSFITRAPASQVANADTATGTDRSSGGDGGPAQESSSTGGASESKGVAVPATPVTSGPTTAAPVKPVDTVEPAAASKAAEPAGAESETGRDAAGGPANGTAPDKYVRVAKDGARVRGYLGIPGVTD